MKRKISSLFYLIPPRHKYHNHSRHFYFKSCIQCIQGCINPIVGFIFSFPFFFQECREVAARVASKRKIRSVPLSWTVERDLGEGENERDERHKGTVRTRCFTDIVKGTQKTRGFVWWPGHKTTAIKKSRVQ